MLAPEPVTVRYNRTLGAWLVVIGATMLLALLVQDLFFDPHRALVYLLSCVCAAYLGFEGAIVLIRAEYSTYLPGTERLVTRTSWGRRRTYPRPEYGWIAYSTGPLRIREIAAVGRGRTIPVSLHFADPEDWAALLDQLHNRSTSEEAESSEDQR
ncbi:MAG TPA: hypothetical protein VHG10_06995 [Glycomyces sp.]|nr:hypothetical protein [Glycomyces sp.]